LQSESKSCAAYSEYVVIKRSVGVSRGSFVLHKSVTRINLEVSSTEKNWVA
jgi:hypothetical protein